MAYSISTCNRRRFRGRAHPCRSSLRRGIRPQVELLEDRTTPSSLWYVNDDAPGAATGLTWNDAFTDLQDALTVATSGDQIWVAAGTYRPDGASPGNQSLSFRLAEGVEVFGGFSGTEATLAQRDWFAHPTFLSGDIGTVGTAGDNTFNVVWVPERTAATVLDGFAIADGNGSFGAGLFVDLGAPTLRNLILMDNTAATAGGGMYIRQGAPSLTNVAFVGNFSSQGGGLYIENGSPTLTNVVFSDNFALNLGGGIYTSRGSPILMNATFAVNHAEDGGGGMSSDNASPTVTNSIFWGNTAASGAAQIDDGAGAVTNATYSIVQGGRAGTGNIDEDPLFVDPGRNDFRLLPGSPAVDAGSNVGAPAVDFLGTLRPLDGDGNGTAVVDMGAFEANHFMVDTTDDVIDPDDQLTSLREAIANNALLGGGSVITFAPGLTGAINLSTVEGGHGILNLSSDVTIDGSGASIVLEGGSAKGATTNAQLLGISDGVVVHLNDLTLRNGYTTGYGAGLWNQGTLTITNCTFADNLAAGYGGALGSRYGTVVVTGSTFVGNMSGAGGALFNDGPNLGMSLTNSTLVGNSGSGLYSLAPLTVTNCTIAGNIGSGIYAGIGSVTLSNALLAQNTGFDYYGVAVSGASTHNLIQRDFGSGLTNGLAGNIIGAGVTFVGLFPLGDFGGPTWTAPLLPGSQAIDAGTSGAGIPLADQRGIGRVGPTDIGAFESQGFTLAATGGSGQSTFIGTAFAAPLTATVSSAFGEPVAGGKVTFTAPIVGASAVLAGSPATIAPDGTASVSAAANGTIGANYTVTATAAGATTAAFTLSNSETPSLVVTTTDDVADPYDGRTSLREALAYANSKPGDDTITFAVTGTITLASALPDLTSNVSIQGGGGITVDGAHAFRVFHVGSGAVVALAGLTIVDGYVGGDGDGGGIYNAGTLTVEFCAFSGNAAGYHGGALANISGSLTVADSLFQGNTADYGGGVYTNYGTVALTNTTFTGNGPAAWGGALANHYGDVTLTNSTVVGNSAWNGGGGIYNHWTGSSVTLLNTIVAGNSDDIFGPVETASSFNNLIGTGGSGGLADGEQGNLVGVGAPLLAPLGDYGGPTLTMPLLPGSQAIDAGTSGAGIPLADQRGIGRVGPTDIGAFESQGFTLAATGGSGQSTPIGTAFTAPLTATVSSAFGEPVAGGKVTFTAPIVGASAVLAGSPATIAGDGTAAVTATANGTGGPYLVTAGAAGATSADFSLRNLSAPSADPNGPYVLDVGADLVLDGSGSFDLDPGDAIVLYEWDLDGDGAYDDAVGATPTISWATLVGLGLAYPADPATGLPTNTIGLRVTDSFGLTDTAATMLTIYLNEPTAAFTVTPEHAECGQFVTFDATGSSHGHPGHSLVQYEWDFDFDGFYDDASGMVVAHAFSAFGTYEVGLRVTDDAGKTDTVSHLVFVDQGNLPPVANPGGPYVVEEGTPLTLDGTGSTDPNLGCGDSIVQYEWDLHYDGATFHPEHAGALLDLPAFPDDFAPRAIALRVTDEFGATHIAATTLEVVNVPPTVEPLPEQHIDEGDRVDLPPAVFHDVGVLDSHTAAILWGDGSPEEPATVVEVLGTGTGTVAAHHTYADEGVYHARLRVTDDGGEHVDSFFDVYVSNVPPTVEPLPEQHIDEGDRVDLPPAVFHDVGLLDSHTATILWGDGSPEEPATVIETLGTGTGTVAAHHTYADEGVYHARLRVTDDGGEHVDSFFDVYVSNVPPTVEPLPDHDIDEGDRVDLPPAVFHDVGVLDSHTAAIDWGDGTLEEPASVVEILGTGTGTVAAHHTYADEGVYHARLRVTDDGGEHVDSFFDVYVSNVPPTVEPLPEQHIDEGDRVDLPPAVFHDVGVLDSHTATIDWGDGTLEEPASVVETLGTGTGTVAAHHTYADEGVYHARLRVTDDGGEHVDSFFDVYVNNVPPTVEPLPEQHIDEGDRVDLPPAVFHDVGVLDSHTATIDWGDGTLEEPASVVEILGTGTGTVAAHHTYADEGVYTARLRVTDDGGEHVDSFFDVYVNNVPPRVTLTGPAYVDEGADYRVDLAVTDPGTDTITVFAVLWGDGTMTQMAGSPHGLTLEHVYADEGTYVVAVGVIDEDGQHAYAGTGSVVVENVQNFLGVQVVQTLASDNDADGAADAHDTLATTILVTNHGPDPATGVFVLPVLDANLRRIAGTAVLTPDVALGSNLSLDAAPDVVGVFRGGLWVQDVDGSGAYGAGDTTGVFGQAGDVPVVGDWNGDGMDDVGIFRNGLWVLDRNGSGAYDAGDTTHVFGQTGDVPVAGDWNGDGVDDVGIFRQGLWVLDRNGSGAYDAGDTASVFGAATDEPVVGDWNGDGSDEIGVYRDGLWFHDRNGSGAYDAGDTASVFGGVGHRTAFGFIGDCPVVGDWNGDGTDDIGICRDGLWIRDANCDGAYTPGDVTSTFGQPGDVPVTGHWFDPGELGLLSLGTLQPGQTARLDFRAAIRGSALPGSDLITQAFASGTDGGTGLPYAPTAATSVVPVGTPALPPAATAVLQAGAVKAADADSYRVDFRNAGGIAAEKVFVLVEVPAGWVLRSGEWRPLEYRLYQPNTYRLSVGPLEPGQSGSANLQLMQDPYWEWQLWPRWWHLRPLPYPELPAFLPVTIASA